MLTQCCDAVAECEEGTVDVSALYHAFSTILSVSGSLGAGQIHQEQSTYFHLRNNDAVLLSLCMWVSD